MTSATSPRLRVYVALAATALMVALIAGSAELAVLATPFALLVAIALAGEPPALEGDLQLHRDRVVEGERLRATLTVDNRGGGTRVDVHLRAAAQLGGDSAPIGFWLARGERRELTFELVARRWGVYGVGPAIVRASGRLGATTIEGPLGEATDVRVYADVQRLRSIVAPLRTRPVLGSQVSRERGEGIEFADLRPLAPGDRARSINWRATARRRTPYVNVQHPEHSADLVLFLDTFAEAQLADEGTLDAAVRAAASLASTYLAQRDRVALVSLGGELRWLTGSPGTRQLYRILDALFSSAVRLELSLEGGHAPTASAPPGAGPGDRADPAVGRARGQRAARTARPRVRPRGPRDLAARKRSARRPRRPSMEASTRSAALAIRDPRHLGLAL